MDRLNQTLPRGRPVSSVDAAKASDVLEHFISAGTLKTILASYRNMCELLHLKPNVFPLFYPKLKANLNSWKAKALWKKFDARANHKCYARGKVCPNTRVLIIGAGPCGLRTAIEAQLLGAKVVVIEKRDRMSRNNVLHLWPFVIEDLRALGAKKFFGKFCAGAIDHISIRQLQCILLKVALLLGVEVHTEVSFEKLVEPNSTEKIGWRAEFKPSDHPVSQYEFDVIIGADGKRNTLQGFRRKEFRGKLAIAITANFINKRTEAEARVEEISGVAFIFNQKFFKELNAETGIDLENIVYYKDDTHYFVMTAKKPSLIDKGVIKQDYADTARLLSPDNVDRENLMDYAREAAEFSTNYQMPDLEFAVNHYGQPDVAMFDFTSMYAAENASKVIERHGYKLLMILVGDSLLEPFWPTGSGCARGFLSSLDACWAIKAWGSGLATPLEVLAERESIYRLLAQTTPENLNKDCKAYTLDPSTRYPNLNRATLVPQQVLSLYDTDDPSGIELTSRTAQPISTIESHRKRRKRDAHLDPNTLINWIKEQIREYEDLTVEDVTTSFRDGRVLCAILHHYRPDLVDYSAIKSEDVAKNNQLAFDLLEKEIGISPVMTGNDMAQAEVPDYLTMFSYLTQIYDTFRGEIPHIKHPKLTTPPSRRSPKFCSFVKPSSTPQSRRNKLLVLKIQRQALKAKCKAERSDCKMSRLSKTDLAAVNSSKTSLRVPYKELKHFKSKIPTLKTELKLSKPEPKAPPLQLKAMKIDTKEGITEPQTFQPTHTRLKSGTKKNKATAKMLKVKSTITCFDPKVDKFQSTCKGGLNFMPVKSMEEYTGYKITPIYEQEEENHKQNFIEKIRDITFSNEDIHNFKNSTKELQNGVTHATDGVYADCNDVSRLTKSKNKQVLQHFDKNAGEVCSNHSSASDNSHHLCTTHKSVVRYFDERFNELFPRSNGLSDNEDISAPAKETSKQRSRAFDEHFREVFTSPGSISGESEYLHISSSNDTSETLCANMENAAKGSDDISTDSSASVFLSASSAPSDIVLRHVEEDQQTISIQELRFSCGSNTLTINVKPKTHKKGKTAKVKNPGCCEPMKNKQNKQIETCHKHVCQFLDVNQFKFLYLGNMSDTEVVSPELTYDRIMDWINLSDFKERDGLSDMDTDMLERLTDITSVTKNLLREEDRIKGLLESSKPTDIKVEERTAEVKCTRETTKSLEAKSSVDSMGQLMEKLKSDSVIQFAQVTPWSKPQSVSEPPVRFSAISENEETDLPDTKESSRELLKNPSTPTTDTTTAVINQFTVRPKRHAEAISTGKPAVVAERRTKKRRSFEKYEMSVEDRCKRLEEIAANRADRQNKRRQQRKKQTERFIKSMQMLHANAKPGDPSGPFEDYSIFVYRQTAPHFQDRVKNLEKKFTYVPDRDNRLPSQSRGGGADEEFAARIKDLEDKWRDPVPVEKKPKDLLRAIGKIETSDWNIKEIEKKIMENKLGKSVNKEKERVPKWNREQFIARQTKMENKHLNRQNSTEAKFTELDKSIKHLEQRLKEGSVRDLGKNKVATITEKLVTKVAEPEVKPVQKSNSKAAVMLPTQSGSEYCHFCQKRVYLMERLSAEGRFFHRGCFKCQYCHTTLRLGSYLFDRDGQYGHRFYCSQHFGMPGELYSTVVDRKNSQKISKENVKPLEKLKIIPLTGVEGVDLLDRVQTPERIEFANLSAGHVSSDHDESLSQMDEDEWTDRNFGASTAEVCSSDEDEDSSSLSGSESDNEDAYEEALEEPPTKEGTLRWMERYKQRYSKERRNEDDSDSEDYSSSSDHSSYYENSSGDEEDEPATEGEEEIRARELRKQEVRVEPPVVQTDTGSDTEIVSDESSPESSSKHNSATEISTDSEFAVDEPTPTREIPSIVFNDFNVTKSRGTYGPPKKVQVKSSVLQSPVNGKMQKRGIQLEFTPLVPSPVLPKPAPTSLLTRTEGYALNRTQSTGGIATKVSLELKKKYLLGDSGISGSIQKSGSVSTLDSKFKSFHTNISDCQKLLKPAPEISPSMQVFCSKLNERRSPLSPIVSQAAPFADNQPLKSPDVLNPGLSPFDNKSPVIVDLTVSPEQPDITKCSTGHSAQNEDHKPAVFEHELEGRPRSPVQEIPIIVPKIDWNLVNKMKDSDISSDSLTTSDSDSDEHTGIQKSPTVKIFNNIPRVEVHDDAGEVLHNSGDDVALDSLCPAVKPESKPETRREVQIPSPCEAPKSISSEKKSLNQPKTLPGLQKEHVLAGMHTVSPDVEQKHLTNTSGQSTPSEHDSYVEHTAAAMTETELSDWARDSAVSDDFEDVEFELNPDLESVRKSKQRKGIKRADQGDIVIKAHIEEFDDIGHVCGREKEKQIKEMKNKISLTENLSNVLSSIEFMDTGEETSSDEKMLVEASLRNNGYMEFQNEDDIAEDSLNPNINEIVETVNPEIREVLDLDNLSSYEKNTGYCIIGNEDNFGSEVITLHATDLEKLKEKQNLCDNEEDSLLIIETGTTTEENTCSDSTVKNLITQTSEKEKKDALNAASLINENKTLIDKIRGEQKPPQAQSSQQDTSSAISEERQTPPDDETELVQNSKKLEDANSSEYQEHCRRLQSKVEFGNVRDSIDIRKSKRKDRFELPPKPDLIQEEISSPTHLTQTDASPPKTPKVIYTKEEIKKSRDENQRLVQEMVMNRMKAQNRSLERKRRSRNSFSPSLSPSRLLDLNKSATTDISLHTSGKSNDEAEKRFSTYSTSSSVYSTPDVLLSTNETPKRQPIPLEKSQTMIAISELSRSGMFDHTKEASYSTPVSSIRQHPKSFTKQLSIHSSFQIKPKTIRPNLSLPDTPLTNPEAFSLPDIQQALRRDDYKTSKALPRQRSEEARRTTEKQKQEAKTKARLKSNEDLGLSPEDKLKRLREKMCKRGKENENIDVHVQDSIESLVINTERRNSLLYSNDTLTKKRNNSFKRSKSGDDALHSHSTFSSSDLMGKLSVSEQVNDSCVYPMRTKSVSEISKPFVETKLMDVDLNITEEDRRKLQFCKSDPNLLTESYGKAEKKSKSKDRERRKSITKLISEFFGKKKEGTKNSSGSPSKSFLSRISPKSKSKDKIAEEIIRTKSFTDVIAQNRKSDNVSPPPIPPLPLNYTGSGPSRCTDDSSDGENEWKRHERSSCDTLDQSGVLEGRRVSRSARKAARQAQLKRHRMAQEIQRKLEETEVKTRELEQRGVRVEKALRGETSNAHSAQDESDLLKEWFDLMRDLTEVRRYERELMVRAQELELEDRHARLQQDLRERLDNDEHKTKDDIKAESSIINEMMEIVAKRDSLIALLEQDRLRYSEEDRDFEEQMLAKGLRLTPLKKNPVK